MDDLIDGDMRKSVEFLQFADWSVSEMAALRESKRSLYREIERIEGERLSLATQVQQIVKTDSEDR